MPLHYSRLSEKERRHYAGLEVIKLGYGSKLYIRQLFGISQKTIEKGILELEHPLIYSQIPQGKQRRIGGGRKKIYQPSPIRTNLITFIDSHKAGSPTDPTVFWIHLKPREIASQFYEQYQEKVSHGSVKRLLKELGYSYRKMSKTLATGIYAKREEQFKIIMSIIFAMSLKVQSSV